MAIEFIGFNSLSGEIRTEGTEDEIDCALSDCFNSLSGEICTGQEEKMTNYGKSEVFQFPIERDMHERYGYTQIASYTDRKPFQFPIGRDMHYCRNAVLLNHSTVRPPNFQAFSAVFPVDLFFINFGYLAYLSHFPTFLLSEIFSVEVDGIFDQFPSGFLQNQPVIFLFSGFFDRKTAWLSMKIMKRGRRGYFFALFSEDS